MIIGHEEKYTITGRYGCRIGETDIYDDNIRNVSPDNHWPALNKKTKRGCTSQMTRIITIHKAKESCIQGEICDTDDRAYWSDAKDRCEFTVWDVQLNCQKYDKTLGDYKIAKRHLDAQVEMGRLGKNGSTYIWYGKWDRLPNPC